MPKKLDGKQDRHCHIERIVCADALKHQVQNVGQIRKLRERRECIQEEALRVVDQQHAPKAEQQISGKDRAHDQPEAQSALEVRLSRCVQPDSLTRTGLCGRFIRARISVGLRLLMIGIRLDGDGLSVALDQRAAVRADQHIVVDFLCRSYNISA